MWQDKNISSVAEPIDLALVLAVAVVTFILPTLVRQKQSDLIQ